MARRRNSKKPYNKYGAKKTEIDGIVFDSILESKYYLHLKELKETGEVVDFELQPEYILQKKFKRDGKTIQPIKYRADFKVFYSNGDEVVVDTKGMTPTADFKIKRKMLWYHYPEIDFKVIKYVKKFGGWIEIEEYEKLKKQEKKNNSISPPEE